MNFISRAFGALNAALATSNVNALPPVPLPHPIPLLLLLLVTPFCLSSCLTVSSSALLLLCVSLAPSRSRLLLCASVFINNLARRPFCFLCAHPQLCQSRALALSLGCLIKLIQLDELRRCCCSFSQLLLLFYSLLLPV